MTTKEPQPTTQGQGVWMMLLPWFRLMRLPTVFTALADILCGYLLTHDLTVGTLMTERNLWLLLCASGGLYLSGMVLNDVFDAALDLRERPERPIPSGCISRRAAAILGCVLMAIGVIAAASVSVASLLVASAIVAAVLLYDAIAKSTPAGPCVMGACRGLNILLGASAGGALFLTIESPHFIAAAALMTYIIGVTVFARNEAGNVSTGLMAAGLTILLSGIAIDAWMFRYAGFQQSAVFAARTMLGLLAANLLLRGVRAIRTPQPRLVQKTVGFMLLCIIFLDAAVVFAATADARLAAIVVILTIPATLMKRAIPLS
jgi:UbiA prenyltransferase family